MANYNYDILETVSLLLDKRGHEFFITEDIIKTAASSDTHYELLSLLHDKRGLEYIIIEDIFKTAITNTSDNRLETVSLPLNKRGHELTITEDIVQAAVANPGHERVRNNDVPEMVTLQFDQRGHEFIILDDIFKAEVRNYVYGVEIVPLLLDRHGDECEITRDIIEEVRRWEQMLALLQQRRSNVTNFSDYS